MPVPNDISSYARSISSRLDQNIVPLLKEAADALSMDDRERLLEYGTKGVRLLINSAIQRLDTLVAELDSQ